MTDEALKTTLLCFLLTFGQQANALNIPEKYQSPQKIENKASFIKNFFSYKELRYKSDEGDPKLWRQIETCETKYDGGALILEQYMYNNWQEFNGGGGLIGLLFHIQNGEVTFIHAAHTLTNYRMNVVTKPIYKCFTDSVEDSNNRY